MKGPASHAPGPSPRLPFDSQERGVIARLDRANQYSQTQAMLTRTYYVYILASALGGTLYIGVTNNLVRRVYEHRDKRAEGFTKKYDVWRLVYFEQCDDIEGAIRREKRLKKWNRAWAIRTG